MPFELWWQVILLTYDIWDYIFQIAYWWNFEFAWKVAYGMMEGWFKVNNAILDWSFTHFLSLHDWAGFLLDNYDEYVASDTFRNDQAGAVTIYYVLIGFAWVYLLLWPITFPLTFLLVLFYSFIIIMSG